MKVGAGFEGNGHQCRIALCSQELEAFAPFEPEQLEGAKRLVLKTEGLPKELEQKVGEKMGW